MDIIFWLFVAPDGNLAHQELINVLRKRGAAWVDERSDELDKKGLLSCLYACAFERS